MAQVYNYEDLLAGVGKSCARCGACMNLVVRTDLRLDFEKVNHPLTKRDLTILNCLCLHPGDLVVGGFF